MSCCSQRSSCDEIISKEAAEKVKLPIEKHTHPYKIAWFRKGNEVLVTYCCLVNFSMGYNVDSEAMCDTVPMDACHILWVDHGYITMT